MDGSLPEESPLTGITSQWPHGLGPLRLRSPIELQILDLSQIRPGRLCYVVNMHS
jgi:hypothetical protein